ESPLGGGLVRGPGPGVPGRLRLEVAGPGEPDRQRVPDHSGSGLLDRVRALDGLRGHPRGPSGGGPARRSWRGGGARPGGLTGAAAIMVIVFAGFTLGEFLPIKMLGLALSVAVLVDAIAVRMVIGPALLRLAGRWNWWPGGVGGR